MFKKDSKEKAATMQSLTGKTSVIAVGAEWVGNLVFEGALQVDGKVQGSIHATAGMVHVSGGGKVEGEIRAPHVILDGEMVGDVFATEQLELGSNARVRGDVHYGVMEMARGAQVDGSLRQMREEPKLLEKLSGEKAAAAGKPVAKPAAPASKG